MSVAITSNRYAISDYLRDLLSQDQCAYMTDLDRLFTEHGALSLVLEDVKGASKGSLMSVLYIICNATLGWGKLFERLSRCEFTRPREAGGTLIPGMSERTVIRALNALEKAGLICRFRSLNKASVHYGLRIDTIFAKIKKLFPVSSTCSKSEIKVNMFARLSESPLLEGICRLISYLAGKVISCLNDAKELIKNAGGIMGLLAQGVKAAKTRARKKAEERMTARASMAFYKDDGKPNPVPAIEYWNKEIRDSELYAGSPARKTGRIVGMMKNWLHECKENGLTEEQIRANIHQYILRWYYVAETDRTMTLVSKNGRYYETRLSAMPDFEFFYPARQVITPILMNTRLPGKYADGTDRVAAPSWFVR